MSLSVLTNVRPAGPQLMCSSGCGHFAQIRGRCIECFETSLTWQQHEQLCSEARDRRRAWLRAQLASLRGAWLWIVAAVAVEYLLLWEFREWFIEIGQWFYGGAN